MAPRAISDAERARWLADPLPADPMRLADRWMAEARERSVDPGPGAVALATADADGRPSVRMVLCRGVDLERGFFVFYTSRESPKARALEARPSAALCFYWEPLARQIRVEGPVVASPDAESDAYFATRPLEAQLAAWASRQSAPLAARGALLERMRGHASRFGVDRERPEARVPRPPHWGGYRVFADRIEFWVSREGRVHDRALYRRDLVLRPDGEPEPGPWSVERLQP